MSGVVGARLGSGSAAGEGEAQDGALDGAELPEQRPGVVGQGVAFAEVLDPGRDLGVAGAGHVGKEVVLDLVAEVAAHHVKERTALDVRRADHLADVERTARLTGHFVFGEGVGLVGEVPAEDDHVGPHVADHVGREVRRQRAFEAAAAGERGEGEVVLDGLPARLAAHALELVPSRRPRLLPAPYGSEVEVVHRHAPFEDRGQQHVVERLQQVDRVPFLVRVDPHDLVAEVAVLAQDVGVGVVDVVVGVLPRLRGGRGVPVPVQGVDLGIVHPVPLAVHDVVADLHVLQDLAQRQQRGAGDPRGFVARGDQQQAAEHDEPAVHLDHARDVAPVAIAEVLEDLVVDRVQFAAERIELLRAQPGEWAVGHGWHRAVSSRLTGRSPRHLPGR